LKIEKKNTNLKTQLRLGYSDLVLMVKEKGDKEWTNEKLDAMGPIPDADFNKYWPNKKLR